MQLHSDDLINLVRKVYVNDKQLYIRDIP